MSKHLSMSPLFCFLKYIMKEARISIEAAQINIRCNQRYSFYCSVCKEEMEINRLLLQTAGDLPFGEVKVVIASHRAIQYHYSSYNIFSPQHLP